MVERIRALLQARQLSPTQFADAIGVARPIVSHILSGRNKPSLEVVQKIIGAFPDLSIAWLLNGTEPMRAYKEPVAAVVSSDAVVTPENTARAVEAPQKRPRAVSAAPVVAAEAVPAPPVADSLPQAPAQPAATSPATPAPVVVPTSVAPAPASGPSGTAEQPRDGKQTTAPNPLLALAEPGKKIRRIVIFYQDGTFADYQPE